jgi:hypothetical protein
VILLVGGTATAGDDTFFESKIRPVLADTCFRCHGGQKTGGKLRVDSRDALLKGGDSGAAIVAGDPEQSLLIQALRRADDVAAMPPDKPLPPEVVAHFVAWVKSGAPWPAKTAAFRTTEHWSFLPVKPSEPPSATADSGPHPIDRFLAAKWHGHRLSPVGKADKVTIIRRATFDLLGLPPTPEEVETFVNDVSPEAFAKLVDRLLTSPHYGEKWGRHWLDVVRYADTAGETADFPAPHAWRYRNYVIEAFNRDKPYDQFVREQIAGDILAAESGSRYAELVTATGFLSIARRFGFDVSKDHFLTIDDTLDMVGKSVLGLTITCARCHDHKYDPISMADYYGLYGIFESTRYPFPGCEKAKTPTDMVPLVSPAEFDRVVKPFQQRLAAMDETIKKLTDEQAAVSRKLKESAAQSLRGLARGEFNDGGAQDVVSGPNQPLPDVAVRTGQMIQLSVLPRANHGADSTRIEFEIAEIGGQERRWNVVRDVIDDLLAGNPHADKLGNKAVWCFLDLRNGPSFLPESIRDLQQKPGLHAWRRSDTPSVFVNATEQPIAVWTPLPPRSLFVHPAPDGAVALGWLSPIDGTIRITGRVSDAHPGGGDGVGWSVDHFAADMAGAFAELSSLADRLQKANRQRTELAASGPQVAVAYAVAEGEPHDVRMHLRGDPNSPGDAVPRRFLSAFGGQIVPPNAGSGRRQLAEWLTSADNPLTARVMVNRIWKHHFGVGLVKTSNDFGTRGEPPSHPELLDWLAAKFVAGGWSMKSLHRTIMLSEAYQRASVEVLFRETTLRSRSDRTTLDSDNTWLSRFSQRRLTAEEIRDAVLAVSGDLDRTQATAHPFPDEKSWGFTQHAPFAAVYDHDRRSVYLMTQRIKRHPFLSLFDGPDANSSTADRYTTTVPTQALFFLNDPFIHAKCESLSKRLAELPNDTARLDRAYRLLFARPPRDDERAAASRFLTEYVASLTDQPEADRPRLAWGAWLRVLMSSNEFIYVD